MLRIDEYSVVDHDLNGGDDAQERGFRMSETDDFLAAIISRQIEADTALHNGDAAPRMALWTRRDPVTVLGAARSATGWDDVRRTFEWVASTFSDCASFNLDLIAAGASGDLAYTVGYEHTKASINGAPQSYTLRVTHAYRREDGEWKIAHRHADATSQVEWTRSSGERPTNT